MTHDANASTALFRLHGLARNVGPGQVLVSPSTAALLEGDGGVPDLRSIGDRAIFDESPVYEIIDSG